MTTFKEWFTENLGDYAEDIANHGADGGFPHITYNNEAAAIYEQFEDEIYEMLRDDADAFGHANVDAFTATFRRADMLDDPLTRKVLLVWYACERIAHETAAA